MYSWLSAHVTPHYQVLLIPMPAHTLHVTFLVCPTQCAGDAVHGLTVHKPGAASTPIRLVSSGRRQHTQQPRVEPMAAGGGESVPTFHWGWGWIQWICALNACLLSITPIPNHMNSNLKISTGALAVYIRRINPQGDTPPRDKLDKAHREKWKTDGIITWVIGSRVIGV